MFRSFVWGGFEGASHKRADRQRVDAVAGSGHDRWAALDHAILRGLGLRTAREALRWHRIEHQPGQYDWNSAEAQIEGAAAASSEVIWDICHWGVPDHVDVMSPDWPERLADFAAAAARWIRSKDVRVGGWVPINEIAFWAWAGGSAGGFAPYLHGSGDAFKHQLMLGHLAVVQGLRAVGASEPVLLCEPLIWAVPHAGRPESVAEAEDLIESSFHAVHWLLAQDPACIQLLGLNYYPHNQWEAGGPQLSRADPRHRPLSALLCDVARRFPGLPLALAETGAEEPSGDAWLADIAAEVAAAMAAGVDLRGVCIYPVMDYAGWDDERHCPCGPIGQRQGRRFVRQGQRAAIRELQALEPDPLA